MHLFGSENFLFMLHRLCLLQCIFHSTQNAPGTKRCTADGIHLCGLFVQHLIDHALCSIEIGSVLFLGRKHGTSL